MLSHSFFFRLNLKGQWQTAAETLKLREIWSSGIKQYLMVWVYIRAKNLTRSSCQLPGHALMGRDISYFEPSATEAMLSVHGIGLEPRPSVLP